MNLYEILGVPVTEAGELTQKDLRAAVEFHRARESEMNG